jgi:hypothetical protein
MFIQVSIAFRLLGSAFLALGSRPCGYPAGVVSGRFALLLLLVAMPTQATRMQLDRPRVIYIRSYL